LTHYQLLMEDKSLISNLLENNKILLIYYNESVTDSLGLHFIVKDSLQQTLDSLVYVKFEESTKKPDKFIANLAQKNGPINKSFRASINFNKPIVSVNYDSIYFQFDSLYSLPVNDSMISTNYSNDEYIISLDFDDIFKEDSIHNNWSIPFKFIISKGSFLSVENDSISAIKREYSFKNPKDFGIIRGTIATNYSSFTIQLVDKNFVVVEEITLNSPDVLSYEFRHITPGSYSIRVLIDENNNGAWDPGNIKLKELPEKIVVFFHPNVNSQQINLRANWEQSGLELKF